VVHQLGDGRIRLYADIAHPINAACRDMIQKRVVSEYEAELAEGRGHCGRSALIGLVARRR
jgi:DNA-binding cell septation regulator SpoVG